MPPEAVGLRLTLGVGDEEPISASGEAPSTEFSTSSQPTLDIHVIGTTPIRKIDIVRQVEGERPAYVASFEPGERTLKMSWTDRDARAGKVNMYYVRVQQENEALAWASPFWIRYQP